MGKLEQYARDHRDLFDSEEPPRGHFERFEERLEASRQPRMLRTNRSHLLKVAALILLLISTGVFVVDLAFRGLRDQLQGAGENTALPAEIREAEQYYNDKTNTQIASLCTHVTDQDECRKLSREAMQEIGVLDRNTEELKQTLMQDPGNQRIIDAILRNQQMKEAMVSTILERVSRMKN